MDLPESAVVYLRHTKNTPDNLTVEVRSPKGDSLTYESRVIKVQEYTKDVIFRKKLLMYLPFYVLRYEKELETIDKDRKRLDELLKEYSGICSKLEKVLEKDGSSVLYNDLVGCIMEIMDYVLRSHKNARKEMNEMGGKVLETYTEKTRREAKKEISQMIYSAVKDIKDGVKSSELKKKYTADVIKTAKAIACL